MACEGNIQPLLPLAWIVPNIECVSWFEVLYKVAYGVMPLNKTATKLPFHANMPVIHGQKSVVNQMFHFQTNDSTIVMSSKYLCLKVSSHFIIIAFCYC